MNTYSNGFADAPPLTMESLRATQRMLDADLVARRERATDRAAGRPAFIPEIRVDRRSRRAWIEGVEVQRAPVEGGRLYHLTPRRPRWPLRAT